MTSRGSCIFGYSTAGLSKEERNRNLPSRALGGDFCYRLACGPGGDVSHRKNLLRRY
jgi:hypothetical protein